MQLGDKFVQIPQLMEWDQNLSPVPPAQNYQPLMGKLSLLIKLDYLNLPFEKNFQYRYTLWGCSHKFYFKEQKSQLKITTSLESLSKYIWDMNILCIQIASVLDSKQGNQLINTQKRKFLSTSKGIQIPEQQKRIVGYVFVPLRKYFINHFINSFTSQKFVVLDQSKKRIGELGVELKVEMIQQNGQKFKQYLIRTNSNQKTNSYETYSQNQGNFNSNEYSSHKVGLSQKKQTNRVIEVTDQTNQNIKHKKRVTIANSLEQNILNIKQGTNHYKQIQKDLVQNKYSKKNYFSHEDLYLGPDYQAKQIIDEIQNQEEKNQIVRKENVFQQSSKKYRKNEQLYEKPEHTDLSLIKMKWGSNHPSLELMKLRLDEANYIQNQNPNSIIQSEGDAQISQLKIVLKNLSFIGGKISTCQAKYLTISYVVDSKIISKNELNLQSLTKNVQSNCYILNHLMLLNNPNLKDKLLIETSQCREQISLKQFLKGSIFDLRRKDNKKRIHELKYQVVYNTDACGDKSLQTNVQQNKIKASSINANTKQKTKKTKQINKIINNINDSQKQKQVQMKKTPKMMIAEKQNGQKAPFQLKSPINRLLQTSSQLNKIDKIEENIINQEQIIHLTIKYFQKLSNCEDQAIFQVINRLMKQQLTQNQQNKLFNRLQQILHQQRVQNIIQNSNLNIKTCVKLLFESNFKLFYDTFVDYKALNQKYQVTLCKLKNKLIQSTSIYKNSSEDQENQVDCLTLIFSVLDYIKKYKKQKICFGMIKYENLVSIINQKFDFNQNNSAKAELQQIQQKPLIIQNKLQIQKEQIKSQRFLQNNNLILVQSFLSLFCRHQFEFIKITEIQNFVHETLYLAKRIKSKPEKAQKRTLNINFGIFLNLYQQTKINEKQKDFSKLTSTKIYELMKKNDQNLTLKKQCVNSYGFNIYDILFEDILGISSLQSSINLNMKNQSLQVFSNQSFDQNSKAHRRNVTQQSNQPENYTQRYQINIKDHENKQHQKLNTEQQNLIDIVNTRQQEIFSKNKLLKKQQQETIGIQITKKEEFRLQNNIQQLNKSKQNSDLLKNEEYLQENSYIKSKSPKTKYISISYSTSIPYGFSKKYQKTTSFDEIQLFYILQQNSQINKVKINKNGKDTIVLNSFIDVKNKQTNQFLNFETINITQYKSQRNLSIENNLRQKIKVKNIIGSQKYPLQNNEGQIFAILTFEIDQIDKNQEMQYENQLKNEQNQQSTRQINQKYQHFFILNINKFTSLDPLPADTQFRIVYEGPGQNIIIRDIKNDIKQVVQAYQLSRIFSINISGIKIENSQNLQKSHYIKIFKVKKQHQKNQLSDIEDQQIQFPANSISKRLNFPISKTSLPLSRKQNHTGLSFKKNEQANDLVCQFQFQLDMKSILNSNFGINKHLRWLIDGKFRLQVQVFSIMYQKWSSQENQPLKEQMKAEDYQKIRQKQQIWNKKIQKIIKVFDQQNLITIKQQFNEKYSGQIKKNIKFNQILQLISQKMKYRMTQKQIFSSLCFASCQQINEQVKLQYLLNLLSLKQQIKLQTDWQNLIQKSNIKSVEKLYQEFQTFDLQHFGFLSLLKFQVVKKVVPQLKCLNINKYVSSNVTQIKSIQVQKMNDLEQNIKITYNSSLSPYIIIDCHVISKGSKPLIDYIQLLWDLREIYQNNFFNTVQNKFKANLPLENKNKQYFTQKQQNTIQKNINLQNIPSFYRISLKQFKNLRLNGNPCTLEIRIGNKKLFDPIYRCYSKCFQKPYPTLAINTQQIKEQPYIINIFNRLVSLDKKSDKKELYDYRIVQKINLKTLLAKVYSLKNQTMIQTFQIGCQNLEGTLQLQIQCFKSLRQLQIYKNALQTHNQQIDLQFQYEQKQKSTQLISRNETILKKKLIQISNKEQNNKKSIINELLKREFYQNDQSEGLITHVKKDKNKKEQLISDSVINALNENNNIQSRKLDKQKVSNRHQDLLQKTTNQWRQILQKNTPNKNISQNNCTSTKKDGLYETLKQQINKQELQEKFSKFNQKYSDTSSEQSDDQ